MKEIREQVRKDLEEEMTRRTDAAVSVAKAHETLEAATAAVKVAESDYAAALHDSAGVVSVADLSRLTGIGLGEMRRVMRAHPAAKDGAASGLPSGVRSEN